MKAPGSIDSNGSSMVEDRFGILGKVIAGTYLVEEVVAEGGFGVVYRAEHRGFRARVALKCLKIPAELAADARARFLEQFRTEAEVLFRLSAVTPTIVRPLHVDTFPNGGELVPFIALEWLDGWSLDAIIAQRVAQGRPPIGLRKLVRMLTPVARALEQAHALPVPRGMLSLVHQDLKPENLFVAFIGGEQVVKILDFGISKVKANARGPRFGTGEHPLVSFSPAYAAPEQWAPDRFGVTGTWTDVWGLALTIVETIHGGEVFSGEPQVLRAAILDPAQRPTPRSRGVRVSDDVEAIFERALAVDPRTRFPTVRGFWDELLEALDLDAGGQPKWSRRLDPRAEGTGGGNREHSMGAGGAGEGARLPRLTGLPPPGPSNLALDWDGVRESQPPPPPRSPRTRRWRPPPGLDALEFEPPPRSEWPPVLGPPPSSGNIPVVPALEIPAAPSVPADLDGLGRPADRGPERPAAHAADPHGPYLDDLMLESPLEATASPSTAPPSSAPQQRPSTSAPPARSSAPPPALSSASPSASASGYPRGRSSVPLGRTSVAPAGSSVPPGRGSVAPGPSSVPHGLVSVPPGSPTARPGNVLLEPVEAGSLAPGPQGLGPRPVHPTSEPSSSLVPLEQRRPSVGPPSLRAPSLRAPSLRSPPRRGAGIAWGRLAGAAILLVVAVAVAARNQAHAAASGGESLAWGPLPALWISLGLFGVAVVLAAASVLGRSE